MLVSKLNHVSKRGPRRSQESWWRHGMAILSRLRALCEKSAHRWISLTRDQSCGNLTFLLALTSYYINGSVTGDLRRHDAHETSLQCVMWFCESSHWGRVTHLCGSKIIIIGSKTCLSSGRRRAIIWTNAGILLIRSLGIHFSEIQSKSIIFIQDNAFENAVCQMAFVYSQPQCVKMEVMYQLNTYNSIIVLLFVPSNIQKDWVIWCISTPIQISQHAVTVVWATYSYVLLCFIVLWLYDQFLWNPGMYPHISVNSLAPGTAVILN